MDWGFRIRKDVDPKIQLLILLLAIAVIASLQYFNIL